jgi:hypothetical protein
MRDSSKESQPISSSSLSLSFSSASSSFQALSSPPPARPPPYPPTSPPPPPPPPPPSSFSYSYGSSSSNNSSNSSVSPALLCVCCGETKLNRRYIGSASVAVAACVHKGFEKFLTLPFPLPSCDLCWKTAARATEVCRWSFPAVGAFMKENNKGKSLVSREAPQVCSLFSCSLHCLSLISFTLPLAPHSNQNTQVGHFGRRQNALHDPQRAAG